MNIANIILTIIVVIIILFIIVMSISNNTIFFPYTYVKENTKFILISVFLSVFIVGYIIRKFNMVFITSVIILSYIFFIICTTVYSDNYIDSLPDVLDPYPPHLGLNGISMANIYTGTNINDQQ